MNTKQIRYRGGLVVFSIPSSWQEECEAEGGGTFYEPGDDTGTLRLNVITAQPPHPITDAREILMAVGGVSGSALENGNALAAGLSHNTEAGTPISVFWWRVASICTPEKVRVASFTYTVLSGLENSTRTQSDLSFLARSISAVVFAPPDAG